MYPLHMAHTWHSSPFSPSCCLASDCFFFFRPRSQLSARRRVPFLCFFFLGSRAWSESCPGGTGSESGGRAVWADMAHWAGGMLPLARLYNAGGARPSTCHSLVVSAVCLRCPPLSWPGSSLRDSPRRVSPDSSSHPLPHSSPGGRGPAHLGHRGHQDGTGETPPDTGTGDTGRHFIPSAGDYTANITSITFHTSSL